MFLVVFTREVVIQRANRLTEYMGAGYLVVRSDLSVEHKTPEDILQGMNGIEVGASMFFDQSQPSVIFAYSQRTSKDCVEIRVSNPGGSLLSKIIKLSDFPAPMKKWMNIIHLNSNTIALLGVSHPVKVDKTGWWRVTLVINHMVVSVNDEKLSLTNVDGDNRFGYVDFPVSSVEAYSDCITVVNDEYMTAVDFKWKDKDKTMTEYYVFLFEVKNGRLMHLQDNPRCPMSRRSSVSLTGDECGYTNFVQREDDYDIVYTTLRRTHTATLKGKPEMVQAVHLDGNNLMVLYEQPIRQETWHDTDAQGLQWRRDEC